MRFVLADYDAMCEFGMVGRLDFEAFCAGYLSYDEWKAAASRSTDTAAELRREGRRSGATYAA